MASSILKLEASAGSGKTYKLALEYLGRLLLAFSGKGNKSLDPKREREILGSVLAITFTVKAAQEMKRRIVEKLKVLALSQKTPLGPDDREFLEQLAAATGLRAETIIGLSGDLIELVLASFDDFNVKTIDSLMSAMIMCIAPDLDLPADYEIAVDARDELQARGRAMIADLADSSWERLEPFLEEFRRLNAGSGWKTDVQIVEKVTDLFRKTLKQGGTGTGTAPDDLRRELTGSWSGFLETLRRLFPIMQEREPGGKKRRYASGTYLKEPLLELIAEALADGSDLSRLEGFVKSTYFQKNDAQELVIRETPDDQRLRFIAAYRAAQEALQKTTLAFSAFKTIPYREFLGDFATAWRTDKQTLFVEEFSQTLAERFREWSVSGFSYLYLKMSDRFRNFLFDEFQDTSTLQFKALAPLIDEVLSQEKSASLFIVGDRKQAIYRWRGGNSQLMDENILKKDIQAIGNRVKGGFSHTLKANWRSGREIIDFNNRFWAPEAIAQTAAEAGLQRAIQENFRDSRQTVATAEKRTGGYVEFSLQVGEGNSDGEEAGEGEQDGGEESGSAMSGQQLGAVRAIIDRLLRLGYEHADIAVLVRKNAQVRDIVRSLGRERIPTLSDQSLMLDSNARVNEIIAFFRFLDYPPDDLNFHAFISGRIFQQEARSRFGEEMEAFSEDAFIGGPGPMYKLFQEKFPRGWAVLIEPFFQAVGFLPPYDLFSDMTQVFRIYENFPGDTPFIMALGDALHGAELKEGNSIAGFLHLWKKMVDDEETPAVTIPEHTPGVRVLTMHQSKGLEFPAVIVPIDDRQGKNDDPLHWEQEGLFYITKKLALGDPSLKARFEEENIRSSIDLLNLLYVSFTRAKEALFVPVSVKKMPTAPTADKSGLVKRLAKASDIIACHPLLAWFDEESARLFSRGTLAKREKSAVRESTAADVPSKKVLTRSWQETYLVFDKAAIEERRDRAAAERGERIHDLLSCLGRVGKHGELESRVRQLAAQAGWEESETTVVADFLLRADVFQLLARGDAVHPEKEVIANSGAVTKLRRLDRLQTGPEEVLVIDFKTGTEASGEYDSQLREYMAAVAPLYPGRMCRGFLLFIDRGEVKEVACSS
ncbi:MAG: UvrD-helicase domain-containing protein [Candidatus Aminicenantes bacterium]|nr:UvrD-helicase domain-containing protein [Candidatus Aminicenantes bacterium]